MKNYRNAIIVLAILSVSLLFVSQQSVAQEIEGTPEPISLEEALKIAPESEKKILVDVFAEWCPYCQRMHSEVYKDSAVLEAISEHYIWVKINVESDEMVNYHGNEMTEAQFARALENKSVPTTYFLNKEGSILGSQPGFIDADMFSALLNFVGSDQFLVQTFQEFQNN